MGQSNMSKENIINLISFNQYSQTQADMATSDYDVIFDEYAKEGDPR